MRAHLHADASPGSWRSPRARSRARSRPRPSKATACRRCRAGRAPSAWCGPTRASRPSTCRCAATDNAWDDDLNTLVLRELRRRRRLRRPHRLEGAAGLRRGGEHLRHRLRRRRRRRCDRSAGRARSGSASARSFPSGPLVAPDPRRGARRRPLRRHLRVLRALGALHRHPRSAPATSGSGRRRRRPAPRCWPARHQPRRHPQPGPHRGRPGLPALDGGAADRPPADLALAARRRRPWSCRRRFATPSTASSPPCVIGWPALRTPARFRRRRFATA